MCVSPIEHPSALRFLFWVKVSRPRRREIARLLGKAERTDLFRLLDALRDVDTCVGNHLAFLAAPCCHFPMPRDSTAVTRRLVVEALHYGTRGRETPQRRLLSRWGEKQELHSVEILARGQDPRMI